MEFMLKKPVPPSGIDDSDRHLGKALYKILEGIGKSWKLEQVELAAILHREPSTLSTWKKNKSVSVSKDHPAPNDAQVFELIEFFDSLTSLIIRNEDQVRWLKRSLEEFGNKSPMALLRAHPKNLFALREHIDRIARP